jgi:membrane-associated phospholipid phosphatase
VSERRSPSSHCAAWTPSSLLDEARRLDLAIYTAIAQAPTPALDRAMASLSRAADYSRLSIASASILAVAGGENGRRAAFSGLASVAFAATVVNILLKPLGRRRRPERIAQGASPSREVRMPRSHSFPSGHSAAAFAFATGVSHSLPEVGAPLYGLATLVAYSRVHTGVHYPGDVLAGSVLGTGVGHLSNQWLDRKSALRAG